MNLTHAASEVIQKLLIANGHAALPVAGTSVSWPAYVDSTPTAPDSLISVWGSDPKIDGRVSTDGEFMEHYGIQVSVRAGTRAAAWTKAQDIADFLAGVYLDTVTIAGTVYVIHALQKTSGPLPIGREPGTERQLVTINYYATVYED